MAEECPVMRAHGVRSTPSLVVDEKVLVSGRVPKSAEVKQLLAAAMAG